MMKILGQWDEQKNGVIEVHQGDYVADIKKTYTPAARRRQPDSLLDYAARMGGTFDFADRIL